MGIDVIMGSAANGMARISCTTCGWSGEALLARVAAGEANCPRCAARADGKAPASAGPALGLCSCGDCLGCELLRMRRLTALRRAAFRARA